jgi:sugar lactone lactonase YvrE
MIGRRSLLASGAALAAVPRPARGQPAQALAPRTGPPSFRLEETARFEHQATGVAVSGDGRVFVNFPRWTEDSPVSVAEVMRDGSLKPYPDETWNSWRNAGPRTMTVADHFVCVQSVVAGQRGDLWILDPAAPGLEKVMAGGPKLVRVELATNKVAQVIRFGEDVALQGSYLNDVRFHPDGTTAFITDSGARGSIVVVDLQSGRSQSMLDGHPSTQPEKGVEIAVGGKPVRRPDGRGLVAAADGIALSPDGAMLYWQALTGRTLYRLDTALLKADDPDKAARAVAKVSTTNVADGLLMTRDGHLYLTSPEDSSIKLWDGERIRTVIEDPKLAWPDSLAEAPDGSIYVTASRLHEMPWFQPGAPHVLPTRLFRMVKA